MAHVSRQVIAALVALSAATSCTFGQQEEDDPWAAFNLIDAECTEALLRVDPALSDHLEHIEQWATKTLQQLRANLSLASALQADQEAIVDLVNDILGYRPSEDDKQWQIEILEKLARQWAWPIAPANNLTLVVAHRDTFTEHFRTGGSLPDFIYDPVTDKLLWQFWLKWGKNSREKPIDEELRLIPVVIRGVADLQASPILDLVTSVDASSIAVHELVELTIHRMIDFADRNGRWFGDGFANAITMAVLRERGMDAAADQLAWSLDVTRFEDIPRTDLILRYWPNGVYEVKAGTVSPMMLESEQQLRSARYAWSYQECKRIIDEHGVEIVEKIMRAATEQENLRSQYLVGIVTEVTGDDISARLNKYQEFESARNGLALYTQWANQARSNGALEQEFIAYARLTEIALRFGYPHEPMAAAADVLFRMGRAEDAARYIDYLITSSQEGAPEIALIWHEFSLISAVNHQRPDLAYDSIETVLDDVPDHPIGLLVKAHRLTYEQDRPEEARAIAERLLSDDSVIFTGWSLELLETIIEKTDNVYARLSRSVSLAILYSCPP